MWSEEKSIPPSTTFPQSPPTRLWPISRRALGLVLVGAACLKGQELANSAPLFPLPLPDGRGVWGWGAIFEIERVLGAGLILGSGGRRIWIAALVLWTIFLCVAMAEVLKGASPCHCFGRIRTDPRYTAAFDALCLAVLCIVRPPRYPAVPAMRLRYPRNALIGTVAVGGVVFIAWTLHRQENTAQGDAGFTAVGRTLLLSPEKWVGKPCVLSRYTDIGGRINRGEWMVLFYHYDCEHCQRAVPRYLDWFERHRGGLGEGKLALVEMPPYAPPGEALVPADAPVPSGRLSDSQDWLVTAPLALLLKDGTVRAVATGDEAADPSWIDKKLALATR